ncbi:MAG: dihydropteroate synthase [Gammaproteobacteria bacterium]
MKYKPSILGVLNVSPESNVKESIAFTKEEALARARRLSEDGASVIDVGGRSITPDAPPIDDAQEQARVLPVVALLKKAGFSLSIDTWSADTARLCVEEGADYVNYTGNNLSASLLSSVASKRATLIVTFMPYENAYVMRKETPVQVTIKEIMAYFEKRISVAREYGVERIILDPNLGIIHPTVDDITKIGQQFHIINNVQTFRALGCPLMLYAPRKPERLAYIAMAAAVLQSGVDYIRVHHPSMIRQLMAVPMQ